MQLKKMMTEGKPRVAATGIAGSIATLLVWYWNTGLHPSPDPLHLGTVEIGAVVTIVAWGIGPVLRMWNGNEPDQAQVKAVAKRVHDMIKEDTKR